MRALLTPYIQKELGLVILRPGENLLEKFRGRVLITSEPPELKNLPAGELPNSPQTLVNDDRLKQFFQHDRVMSRASVRDYVKRLKRCQIIDSKDGCVNHLTTHDYGNSCISFCHHHDNKYREQTNQFLDAIADANRAACIVESVRGHFLLPEWHIVTMPELCWWAVIHEVSDLLPDGVARVSLRMPAEKPRVGRTKESDLMIGPSASDVLKTKTNKVKIIKEITVDPAPPKSFMRIPKRERWISEKYTKWVKSQPCCGCGNSSDDPHHIIGHGQGGMGTKAHDLFTIPLCRQCHDALHRDVSRWESEHGSQVELLFQFLDRSIAVGAIS